MVLPTVSVRNCYGTCSSRIYSGHRPLKSRLRKLRKARTEVRFWVDDGQAGSYCSSAGLVTINARVFIYRVTSRVVGNPEVGQKRASRNLLRRFPVAPPR